MQAEKKAAQAKISRVVGGMDQGSPASAMAEKNKEWKEIKFHEINSIESEREFQKLALSGKSKAL